MRARLSVVIPTLNAACALRGCLPSLMEGLEIGLIRELVISDGGSTDQTLEVAREAGAVLVEGLPSRGGQLARGADCAKGEWLLFLHADSVLPTGWRDAVQAQMVRGGPAHFRLAFDANGLAPNLVAFWANLRSRLFKLPYGDQGLLIARADYDAVGGFRDIPLMEDVVMVRALRGRLSVLPLAICTSASRYRRDGWVRRSFYNQLLLMRFLAGADPEKLTQRY